MTKKLLSKNKKGFTLVESLISIAIFTFASLALISAIMGFIQLNKLRNEVAIASQLVQAKIEEFKSSDNPSIINTYVLPNTVLPTNDRAVSNIYKNIVLKVTSAKINNNIEADTMSKLTVVAYNCSPCNISDVSKMKIKKTLAQYSTFISNK